MKKAAAALLVLAVFACIPPRHPVEGKACNDAHPCPDPLFCVEGVCSQQPPPDSGNPDGGQWVARILALNLINAGDGQQLYPYVPLEEGDAIPRSLIGQKGVSVLALVTPERVTAVDFSLFGSVRLTRTENNFPYYFFGDQADGGVTPWRPDSGTYRLQVTPFVGLEAGETKIVSFTVTP